MKLANVEADIKRNHIIEQLAKHGITDTSGYTYKELKHKLAVVRAMEVKTDGPEKGWF